MKKKFTILLISALLTGCISFRAENISSIDSFPTQKINKKICIRVDSECFVRGGYNKTCTNYKDDLFETMNNSNLFGIVGVNEYYADYIVDIKYVRDDNYSLFMTIITFLPSLGLIPKFESDKFFVTIDVTNKKTKEHKKTLLKEKMLNVNEVLLFPFMAAKNPAQEYIKLKQDFLDNIAVRIYETIQELEQKTNFR